MKNLKSHIATILAAAALAVGLPSCQDHFDEPKGEEVPVATMKANTTIAEFKELMWQDANNYCEEIPAKENGEHIIIAGRVVSSDYAGNCFRYIILQDETANLNISIYSYNLYLQYRLGQEVVVDLTGLHAGKYRGLFQVGNPSYNSSIPGYETSFMAPELFARAKELNGMPQPALVDTIVVNRFAELGVTPTELRKWQSQVVRFNNVEFVPNPTEPTLSTYHSSGVTQVIRDAEGNTLDIRTSGYANFWNMPLPEGRGDVVAILGYYVNLANSGGWQLTLIDANSLQNFGDPTVPEGSEGKPYSVQQAIAFQVNGGTATSGWVRGYIVGTVAPEIETVTSDNDIEWTATPTLGNTLVIGQTADTKNVQECLIVTLPQGSDLRTYGALRENPGNYGKQIDINGSFATVMGSYGLTSSGSAKDFKIEGVEIGGSVDEGKGTEESPYNCAQIIAMNPSSTTEAVESGVWVSGYIVGYYQDYDAHFEGGGTQRANILISDDIDANNKAQTVCIQLVAQTDARNALNVVDNPGNIGKKVSVYGDVMKYNTLPGIKNTSNYTLDGTSTGPVTPSEAVTSLDENFATAIPATWSQVQIAGNKTWYQREFSGSTYANMTGYNGTAPFDQWLVTPAINMDGVSSKVLSFRTQVNGYASTTTKLEVYVMTQADTKGTNTKLNPTLATAPASGYSEWVGSGNIDLSAFSGTVYIGFRYYATQDANYATWCVTDVKLGQSGSTDQPVEPSQPTDPTDTYKGQFNSFNGGTPKSTYGTYTNSTGWTATNCNILSGSDSGDNNPKFEFIGAPTTLAVCLNGNTTKQGELTSPVLTGGCGTLTFNYGFAYNETTPCEFTVQVLQGATVVKEDIVLVSSPEKFHVYSYSLDVNATGDFSIRIVNNCKGQKTANAERVAIWNLTWTD